MTSKSGNKTVKTSVSMTKILEEIPDGQKRGEGRIIAKLMQDVTGQKPAVWGKKMVGFGQYHYRYASGREGDWFETGFALRPDTLTLYFPRLTSGFGPLQKLLDRLGPHKLGKGCLYVKSLSGVDLEVLKKIIVESVRNPTPRATSPRG